MDALLIIDMQEGSFVPKDQYDVDGVVERINALTDNVRNSGGKVIYILHDGDVKMNLVPETPGWQILSSLQVANSDLTIRKRTNDAFYNTNLARQLEVLGIKRLIITGWSTDQCVDSTVRAAISRDYEVIVASDCHTVRDRPALKAQQVIKHHNGIWENLLAPANPVQVLPAEAIQKLNDLGG